MSEERRGEERRGKERRREERKAGENERRESETKLSSIPVDLVSLICFPRAPSRTKVDGCVPHTHQLNFRIATTRRAARPKLTDMYQKPCMST